MSRDLHNIVFRKLGAHGACIELINAVEWMILKAMNEFIEREKRGVKS